MGQHPQLVESGLQAPPDGAKEGPLGPGRQAGSGCQQCGPVRSLGCSASPAPGDGSEFQATSGRSCLCLPGPSSSPHMERERDIPRGWGVGIPHLLSEKLSGKSSPLGPWSCWLLCSGHGPRPSPPPLPPFSSGLPPRVGAGGGPGPLARQPGLLQLPTDRLPPSLPHSPAKVWVLSGSGLISRLEAWGSHCVCRLCRLRLFSPAMGCHAAVPRLGARLCEKRAGWGRLPVQKGRAGASRHAPCGGFPSGPPPGHLEACALRP